MKDIWKFIFGVLGNLSTIFTSLSPLPTFFRIYKKRSTENFSVLPYATSFFCNLLWAWYALPFITRHNILLLIISVFQVVLQTFYITSYILFAPSGRKAKTLILMLCIFLSFAINVIITLLVLNHPRRKIFAGLIATLSSVAAYAAPLSIMGLVIETKSVEYMPFLLSLANFISGFLWTVYGILGRDVFIIIADGLGFLLCTMQLIVYAIYYTPQVAYGNVKNLLSEESTSDSNGVEPNNIEQVGTESSKVESANACSNSDQVDSDLAPGQ